MQAQFPCGPVQKQEFVSASIIHEGDPLANLIESARLQGSAGTLSQMEVLVGTIFALSLSTWQVQAGMAQFL